MRRKSKGRVKRFDEENNIVEFKKRDKEKLERIEGLDGYETFDPNRSFDVEEFINEGVEKIKKEEAEKEKYDALQIKRSKEKKPKESKRKKTYKRKRRFVYFIAIVLVLVIVAVPVHKIVKLKMEESQLKAEQQELEQEKEDLKEELEKINDPDYIEQQARDQLNLIKPGETLYVLPDED